MRKNRREVGFDVDAYTARLIGRENVSKVEGAILELAKNAYDADATAVCFYYSEQERSLLIMDNGEGMTEEVIRRHWMTIGNSSKKSEYVSQRGRIKTGAKGIGRFALDRISEQCQMWTNTGQEALIWEVCWEDFSDHKRISEVKAQLYDTDQTLLSFVEADSWKNHKMAELFSLPKTGFHGTGTVFRLTSLRDDWTEQLQQKIRRHLANLLPPDAVESFKLYFSMIKRSWLWLRSRATVLISLITGYHFRLHQRKKPAVICRSGSSEMSLMWWGNWTCVRWAFQSRMRHILREKKS